MRCILCCSILLPPSIGAQLCRASLAILCPPFRLCSSSSSSSSSSTSLKFCGADFAPWLQKAHLTHCRRCSWRKRTFCDNSLSSEEHSNNSGLVANEKSKLQSAIPNNSNGSSIFDNVEQKQISEGGKPNSEIPLQKERASSDFSALFRRFWKVASPYWSSNVKTEARIRLAGVLALTLATTGISVGFSFLGRDFYNALASKDQEQFVKQLLYYVGAFIGGIPIFVIRDYNREILALHWRAWMTKHYMQTYFRNHTFYKIQSQSLIDNPDQRIVDDINSFASTSINFAMAFFNATIDLISFSGILFGIYPPLFAVLVVYSIGGTLISVAIGKGLINLNFMQEKREADFRYGLVRVRENAESIAFYGGEGSELQLLLERFKQSFLNYSQLLLAQRNLDFFTSGYRYLIQLLPAAVVAPLYFAGRIEFGVINQSLSAFNHVLGDFSIIVYQFQSISTFSAVVQRLGEFNDVLEQQNLAFNPTSSDSILVSNENEAPNNPQPCISIMDVKQFVNLQGVEHEKGVKVPLLELDKLTLQTPQYTATLVKNLSLAVNEGEYVLVMGPSGTGKTSLLRAIAGLWRSGKGTIRRFVRYKKKDGIAREERYDMSKMLSLVRTVNDDRRINARDFKEDVKQNGEFSDSSDILSNSADGYDIDPSPVISFLPQKPYMVLGTLRQQVLYPTWNEKSVSSFSPPEKSFLKDSLLFDLEFTSSEKLPYHSPQPSDKDLIDVLQRVRLGHLLTNFGGLDSSVEWANVLSQGEQQRLAFARLLLSKPRLVLMDESTSALDEENEALLYRELLAAGSTYISVGHRSSLKQFHSYLLMLTTDDDTENWSLVSMKSESNELSLLSSPS